MNLLTLFARMNGSLAMERKAGCYKKGELQGDHKRRTKSGAMLDRHKILLRAQLCNQTVAKCKTFTHLVNIYLFWSFNFRGTENSKS